ncbi:MAG: hypothetical protein WCG78_01670 [Candidatus Omnitrophota bacterium]
MVIFVVIGTVVGFVIGIFVGFSAIDRKASGEFRKRIETENARPGTPTRSFLESRKEKRQGAEYPEVIIRAPVLDSAGIASDDTTQFKARMCDFAPHGIAVITQYYLQVGLIVEVACEDPKYRFSFTDAGVRNVTVASNGLRIGLQMMGQTLPSMG